MPWKASSVMEERLRFVARLLDGEAMTEVCRDFGISRKTGYKIFDRYKEHGLEALNDRSRRPVRYANQLPVQIESLIVRLKAYSWRRSSGPAPRHRGRAGRTSGRRGSGEPPRTTAVRSECRSSSQPESIRTSSSGSIEGRPVEL